MEWYLDHFIKLMDLIVVMGFVFFLYMSLRKTQMFKVFLGIACIYLVSIFLEEIAFFHSARILLFSSIILVLAMVLVYHQELRLMLNRIGTIATIKKKNKKVIHASIKKAVFSMAKKRVGALIILDDEKTIPYISDDLVEVDAKCTSELLETIFFPKTALHDGAVIIHEDKIAYAGCKLPLSGKRKEGIKRYGTRHMAAIENTMNYDFIAIVVSEETGEISIVRSGNIIKIKDEKEFDLYIKRVEEVD